MRYSMTKDQRAIQRKLRILEERLINGSARADGLA